MSHLVSSRLLISTRTEEEEEEGEKKIHAQPEYIFIWSQLSQNLWDTVPTNHCNNSDRGCVCFRPRREKLYQSESRGPTSVVASHEYFERINMQSAACRQLSFFFFYSLRILEWVCCCCVCGREKLLRNNIITANQYHHMQTVELTGVYTSLCCLMLYIRIGFFFIDNISVPRRLRLAACALSVPRGSFCRRSIIKHYTCSSRDMRGIAHPLWRNNCRCEGKIIIIMGKLLAAATNRFQVGH